MHNPTNTSIAGAWRIAILGDTANLCATLGLLSSLQEALRTSRIIVITKDVELMRGAIRFQYEKLKITVVDVATFSFDVISPVHLFINHFPGALSIVFEAALRSIPIVSARASYVPSVFVANRSAYLFPYQDLKAFARILGHIADTRDEPSRFACEARARAFVWCGGRYLGHEGEATEGSKSMPLMRSLAKLALVSVAPQHRLFWVGNSERPQCTLTFDDGPNPATTRDLLTILRRYDVRATFFLVGNRAEQFPELVRAIVADGHEIGSHSYTHPYFDRLSFMQAVKEITKSKTILEDITGHLCRLFRPPFGKLSLQSVIPAWIHQQQVVMWSIDLKDYQAKDAATIEEKLATHRFIGGDIILYHGSQSASVAALPQVIESALAEGLKFVTVGNL